MKIAVVGAYGKLGSRIVAELKKNSLISVVSVDIVLNNYLCDKYDAVIDASNAEQSVLTAQFCGTNNIPLLIVCTGQTQEQLANIDKYCKEIAYCVCPNLSSGIAFVIKSLSGLKYLKNPYISITETHHIHKKDSPSGTALCLKNIIESNSNIPPAISSIRKGEEIGQHTIKITLPYEELLISHKILDRQVFALGAVNAIYSLSNLPPKKYSFLELLEINND